MRNRGAGLILVLILVLLAGVPVHAATATANVTFTVEAPEIGLTAQPIAFGTMTPSSKKEITRNYPTSSGDSFITISGTNAAALTVQASTTGLTGWTLGPRGVGDTFYLDPSFTDKIYLWISLGEPDGSANVLYWFVDGLVSGSPQGEILNGTLAPGNYGGMAQLLVGPRSTGKANQAQTIVLTWTATAS